LLNIPHSILPIPQSTFRLPQSIFSRSEIGIPPSAIKLSAFRIPKSNLPHSAINAVYLTNSTTVMNALRLLTRTLLRSSTLSFASKKEGKNFDFS